MGASNYIVGILNFVTFLLSIPIIAAGGWLANQHNVECYKYLEGPVIGIGVFILLISLLGFVGACYRMRFLLWIYLVGMLLLILLLFCFTIFAFVVTNKAAGDVVSNKGFKEYKLGDYTTWLQRQIQNPSNWAKVESCLSQAKVCNSLNTDYPTEAAFDQANLSPIQSGCCKPPTACGCTFVNATVWTPCSTPTVDSDCTTYRTNSTVLCFECNSCKAGVLQNINKEWRKVAIVNIVVFVFLVIVYSIGCRAFRNAKYEKNYP